MRKSNYDRSPSIEVKGYKKQVFKGYDSIAEELKKKIVSINKKRVVIAIEYYSKYSSCSTKSLSLSER